jgi:hypothetical protein
VYAPCSHFRIRWRLRGQGPNGAVETTALRTSSRKSTVVLTAYAKWTRQSDAKEAGASAVEP